MINLLKAQYLVALLATCMVLQANAQEAQTNQQALMIDQPEQVESRVERSEVRASEWGLSALEWDRYEALMAGRRGILSPGLDPLTALGVEARTEQERRRYAELQARFEYERIERELAYQQSYDEAIARIAGDKPRIATFSMQPPVSGRADPGLLGLLTAPARHDVVVALSGCDACGNTVMELVAEGRALNVWVTDSDGDDGKIRRWASDLGIPTERVTSGAITLNHGAGLGAGKTLPLVRLRR